jgi:hypothetical protein
MKEGGRTDNKGDGGKAIRGEGEQGRTKQRREEGIKRTQKKRKKNEESQGNYANLVP